jgi:uncharacterized membrane protein YbhN (UPF0104 family)
MQKIMIQQADQLNQEQPGKEKPKNLAPSWQAPLLSFWQGWGRSVIGIIFSLGVILWLVATLDLHQVLLALAEVNFFWVGLGLMTVFLTVGIKSLRWKALLHSRQVTICGTVKALALGQLLNMIFPARLGDLGRVHLITQAGYPSRAQALGTIALEKLWDIILLLGLVVGLYFWYPLPRWLTLSARLVAASGAILLAGILILLLLRRHQASRWPLLSQWTESIRWQGSIRIAGRLLDGLSNLQRPRVMLAAAGWSLLAWFFAGMTNLVLLKAFGLSVSVGIAFFLLVVLHLGVAVPSMPGRIGVFEGLSLVVLALFGIEANVALAYGIILHTIVLLPPVILGLWWLLRLDAASRRVIWKLI